MAKLEFSINCLCLIVPDPQSGAVHVLMPSTHHHHPHVVKVRHAKSSPEGLDMKGWILELGSASGQADTDLQPSVAPHDGAEIVDLTPFANRLDRAVIDHPEMVVSRIVLHAGRLKQIEAEAQWEFDGRPIASAHRVVWEIDDIGDDQLNWRPFGVPKGDPPFRSLTELGSTGDALHFDVYHVAANAWPPEPWGSLDPEQVRSHFLAFYHLYGIHSPDERMLPANGQLIGGMTRRVALIAEAARENTAPDAVEVLANIAANAAEAASKGDGMIDFREIFRHAFTYHCLVGKGSFA